MSAKECAIQDMLPELKAANKSFLAFRKELNPVMRNLVKEALKEQRSIPHYNRPDKSNSQLVCHCMFCKSGVSYNNYSEYYDKV